MLTGLEFGDIKMPTGVDPRLVSLLEAAKKELAATTWTTRTTYADMRLVRDQLEGGAIALSERYHPPIPGLSEEQQERVRRARRHVNLAEAALDRLTNSIHAGQITRRANDAGVQKTIQKRGHRRAMAALCDNAFAYGTGFLVPILRGGVVRYWHPDPLWTILITDPMDICNVRGLIQMVRDEANTRTIGIRFVAAQIEGTVLNGQAPQITEHGIPFAPIIVAYGRDQRHRGRRYGKSLIIAAAEGSIQVTNNELNLELLRDRQTQALLKVWGQPANTTTDSKETTQKYLLWNDKEAGDAAFITPESRLEQVIKVTERMCTDVTISTGLPLDTFRPEMVAGSDASATAARWRAFPLQQRMVRMVLDWEQIEESTIALIAALGNPALVGTADAPRDFEEIAEEVGARVNIMPSLPEAEAETLAGWQQKTEKFFCQIEEAIEYYSGHLSKEEKAALAALWRAKHQPAPEGNGEEDVLKWKREIVRVLYQDAKAGAVMVNMSNLRKLMDEVGIERDSTYEEPLLPVAAATEAKPGDVDNADKNTNGKVPPVAGGESGGAGSEDGAPAEGDKPKNPVPPQFKKKSDSTTEDTKDTENGDEPKNTDDSKVGTIFGYHIDAGIVKINEVRAQLNLPPIKDGEFTVPQLEAMLKESGAPEGPGKG